MGWYMVNNMLDREATTFGSLTAVAATTETPDKAGLQLTVSSEFKTVLEISVSATKDLKTLPA